MTRTTPTAAAGELAPATTTPEPTASAPRSARRQRTRERLLDAALDLFAEAGVATTSIEAVCERAGFTRGAFYSNFADKARLIDELAQREQEIAVAQLRAAIDAGPWQCDPADDDADDLAMIGAVATTLLDALALDRRWGVVNSELRIMAMRDRAIAASLEAREETLLGEVAAELVRLAGRMGRALAIPAPTFVRLLWAGFQADLEAAERAAPGGPSTSERAATWMPVVVARLTHPSDLRPT